MEEGLDDEALAQQELVQQGHEVVLHVAANAGNQVEAALPELVHHLLGDVALIAKHLALESSSQCCQGVTVMDVSSRDPYCHDLALVIDHQMELEPKEPTHGTATPLGHSSEHLVVSTPCVMTDGQLGAIYNANYG